MTDLQAFTRLGMGSAKVEACFTLGHKVDARVPNRGVGDDARSNRSDSQLRLLWATPPVGMAQHQLDIVRDGVPSEFSIRLGGYE